MRAFAGRSAEIRTEARSGLPRRLGRHVVGERDIERWFANQQTREARRREVCVSKRWFATESEARAVASGTESNFGGHLTCYRCERCNRWHLGGGRGRSRE